MPEPLDRIVRAARPIIRTARGLPLIAGGTHMPALKSAPASLASTSLPPSLYHSSSEVHARGSERAGRWTAVGMRCGDCTSYSCFGASSTVCASTSCLSTEIIHTTACAESKSSKHHSGTEASSPSMASLTGLSAWWAASPAFGERCGGSSITHARASNRGRTPSVGGARSTLRAGGDPIAAIDPANFAFDGQARSHAAARRQRPPRR
jgi:hypothetical protein